MTTQHEMVKLFTEQLRLCALKPDETVIVLSEHDIRADYAAAFMLAARDLGATPFQITVPLRERRSARQTTGRTAIAGNRPVIEALKKADLIIDVMGTLFSPEQDEICATGTRMLFVREPFDVLAQNFPTTDLRRRIEHGEGLLCKAKTLRIWSEAGTDATFDMGGYRVMTQYGYTDTPGRWDHMGTGQVLSQAYDGKVNGTVMVMPGDTVTAFQRMIESPVRLTIRDGFVVGIDGDGTDAPLMRDYMESFRDPRAYAISHIGWGLLNTATWFHRAITRTRPQEISVNSLSYYGNVLFSLGPNTELGGSNDTQCHLDIPLRKTSLSLDGVTIVDKGRIAIPEMAV
ncbi:leucyl aminopeptidase [Pararhizobium polonicum]|uniref:Leucyl aminopeptidase n=1 Tax=Pararhizobium polonicum TaxID=1612624 RepID=A0A1C7P2Y0_9HYPH|nr:leucyl aminopeptidase [Pararhizobium polonicum]OBZ95630.1 leucyl aminopeptidase [Pararhizobium polonicum]